MALLSLKDAYPDYRDTFKDNSISHIDEYSVYADGDDKVGSVEDGLFDDTTGQFRYLVVDTGPWIFGKKVLLPIGRAQFDNNQQRIYVNGLTKNQVEELPKYDGSQTVDYDHEENVRGVYRESSVSQSAPVDGVARDRTAYTRDTYSYDRDADLYDTSVTEDRNQPIRLYEERLIASKNRTKTGDVSIGKRVETETANVSIPVEKERVVIERSAPTDASRTNMGQTPENAFEDGEVARMEVYEETANVRKEAFVREEVNVRKEVEQETVNEQATIRREELDVNSADGTNVVNR